MERYLAKSKPSDDLAAAKAAKAEQNKFGSNKKLPMPESFYKKAKPYDRQQIKRPIGVRVQPPRGVGTSTATGAATDVSATVTAGSSSAPTAGPSRPRLPQSAFYSPAYRAQLNRITSTLNDPSNPITHNDGYSRAQHIVSCSTGHQQSNGGRSRSDEDSWQKSRMGKLREQASEKETDILKGVCIYINGFAGDRVTNQQLIDLVHRNGGSYRPVQSFKRCTHIVTCRGLNGKKTQAEMQRKRGGCLIVTPDWVLDSIAAGRRLPEWKYKIVEAETQASITSKFGRGSTAPPGPSTTMARTVSNDSTSSAPAGPLVEPIDLVSDSDDDNGEGASAEQRREADEEEERLWAALDDGEVDAALFDAATA